MNYCMTEAINCFSSFLLIPPGDLSDDPEQRHVFLHATFIVLAVIGIVLLAVVLIHKASRKGSHQIKESYSSRLEGFFQSDQKKPGEKTPLFLGTVDPKN